MCCPIAKRRADRIGLRRRQASLPYSGRPRILRLLRYGHAHQSPDDDRIGPTLRQEQSATRLYLHLPSLPQFVSAARRFNSETASLPELQTPTSSQRGDARDTGAELIVWPRRENTSYHLVAMLASPRLL